MPTFNYAGDVPRVFPALGLTLNPGDQVIAEENPDEAFFAKAGRGSKAPPAPDPAAFDGPGYAAEDAPAVDEGAGT